MATMINARVTTNTPKYCEDLQVLLLGVGRGTTTPCLQTLRQLSMDDNSNTTSPPCKIGAVWQTESQRKPTTEDSRYCL